VYSERAISPNATQFAVVCDGCRGEVSPWFPSLRVAVHFSKEEAYRQRWTYDGVRRSHWCPECSQDLTAAEAKRLVHARWLVSNLFDGGNP